MSKSVRPFADQGCYTSVHNVLFDSVMPNLKPTSWKILCAIIRATDGWNKAKETISLKKLRTLTGITNDRTILSCLKELEDYDPPLIRIAKGENWKANSYNLNKSASIPWGDTGKNTVEASEPPTGKNTVAPTGKNTVAPTGKNTVAPTGKNTVLPNSLIETIETKEKNSFRGTREKGGEKKAVKVSPEEKPPSNYRHPMAELYREIMEYPALTKLQCDLIAAQVTDEPAWRAILTHRNASGWKGHNVQRALVEYERAAQGETIEQIYGGIENERTNGNGKIEPKRYETKGERNARNTLKIANRLAEIRETIRAAGNAETPDSSDSEAAGPALVLGRR